jgi:hypothetical protein
MREIKALFSKVVLVAMLLALVYSVISVRAVDYTVGVKVGDWVRYAFNVTWTGTGTEPSSITSLKNLAWMKVEIKSVSGTQVTAEVSGQYTNVTSYPTSRGTMDVATGQGSGGFMTMLIAANLNAGDNLFQQQYGSPVKINGTISATYCGAMRSINYVDVTTTIMGSTTSTVKAYWDKATGVMVELYMSQSTTAPTAQTLTYSYKATETNMWSGDILGFVSTYLVYIVVIVILLAVVVVAGVFLMRRRKPTPTVTPSATPTPTAGTPE